MSKRHWKRRSFVTSAAGLLAGATLVGAASGRGNQERQSSDGGGRSDGDDGDGDDGTTLTDDEIEGMQFMREEEKLAHDVYHVMYETWGLTVFENIRASETEHVDAMESLLDRYDIEDPALPGIGEFVNDELQALYDDLIARGETSEQEALFVGALIEETDIIDIQALIDETDEAPIERVYGNLKAGSEDHLRAFVSVLADRGVDYDPVILDEDTYSDIVDG